MPARLEAAVQQRRGDGHGVPGRVRPGGKIVLRHGQGPAGQVGQGIALLGDGEAGQLETGRLEHLHQISPVSPRAVGLEAAGHAGHDFLFVGAVGAQAHQQAQIVVGVIHLVDDLNVEGFGRQDAGIGEPGVQKGLLQGGQEAAEDVARAEMDPDGSQAGAGLHGRRVVPGQGDPRGFPALPVLQSLKIQM